MKPLAIALALMSATPAQAEPGARGGCLRAYHLLTGEAAPCAGDLYPVEWARQLLADRLALGTLRAELHHARTTAAADRTRMQAAANASAEARRACERAAAARLPDRGTDGAAWYASPLLWAPVALVVGALAGYGLSEM